MVRMEGLPNPNGNGPPANVVAPMQRESAVPLAVGECGPNFAAFCLCPWPASYPSSRLLTT
jgi:hypothetical protein